MATDERSQWLRQAVRLVTGDAEDVLGSGAPAVVFEGDDLPDELAILTDSTLMSRSWKVFDDVDAYAYMPGEDGCVGICIPPHLSEAEVVVRVADILQEVAIESRAFFGRGFPPCPEHPDRAPLWAQLVNGRPTWVCGEGGTTSILIGDLRRS